MFVNAILHQKVPVIDEKPAKFFLGHRSDSFRRVVYVAVAYQSTGIKSRLMSDLHPPDDTSANSPSNPTSRRTGSLSSSSESRSGPAAMAPRCRSRTAKPCTCTRPTPGSAKPVNGRSTSPTTASPGHTSTARAVWRYGAAPPSCCWRWRGERRSPRPVSRCSATTLCGKTGWSARPSSNAGEMTCRAGAHGNLQS